MHTFIALQLHSPSAQIYIFESISTQLYSFESFVVQAYNSRSMVSLLRFTHFNA
jgi:hypothetical protein